MPADSSAAPGVVGAAPARRASASRANAGPGSLPARRDRHEPAQPQAGRLGDRVGQRRARRPGAAPPRAASSPPGPRGRPGRRTSTGPLAVLPGPVERRGRAARGRPSARPRPSRATAAALLRWSWPMKCQRSRQVGQLGRLAEQFLGAVLAEVALTQRGQGADVVGRPGLAHREQRHRRRGRGRPPARRRRSAPGRRAGSRPGRSRGDLPSHAPASGWRAGLRPSQTRPAWRPVTPSRRWENRAGSSTVQRGSCTTSRDAGPAQHLVDARPAGPAPGCPCRVADGGSRAPRGPPRACIAAGTS